MKRLKINVDRPKIKTEDIVSKQDFGKVLNGYNKMKTPIFKNPWFYGVIGVATVAVLLTVNSKTTEENDTKITSTEIIQLPEDTKCIHAPVANLDVDFTTISIDPSKDQTIKLPSGTTILVPEGSLMTESNTEVKLKIREFESKSTSFIAGIPMDYKNDAFESAGMIEVRGFEKEKEITISKTKPVQVKMVLTKNPENFSFWKLNEETKEWGRYPSNFHTSTLTNSPSKDLKSVKNKLVAEINKNEVTLSVIDQKSKNNTEPDRIQHNLPIKGSQRFDLEFDTKEFPELSKFKGMEFEVASKTEYDKSFTKKVWSSIDLEKETANYYAIFSSKKEKFKIEVRPVLSGSKKETAEIEFQKLVNDFHSKKNQLNEEAKIAQSKKTALQSDYNQFLKEIAKNRSITTTNNQESKNVSIANFVISEFGVYNCDKPINYPAPFKEEVHFSFSKNNPTDIVSVFIFDELKDARFTFGINSNHNISQLGVNEKSENTLLAVDRNGKLGYVRHFNSSKIRNSEIVLAYLDKKDENLSFIQKLINENTIEN